MLLTGILLRGGGGGAPNLDGHTINGVNFGPSRAGYRFNADGTVDGNSTNPSVYFQIDNATDWVIPNSSNVDGWSIRLTPVSGANPNGTSDAINTFLSLGNGQTREWLHNGSAALNTSTWTVELSRDGGSTIAATGTYVAITQDTS